jgi:plasmid maintenance system antidote protein VapI
MTKTILEELQQLRRGLVELERKVDLWEAQRNEREQERLDRVLGNVKERNERIEEEA